MRDPLQTASLCCPRSGIATMRRPFLLVSLLLSAGLSLDAAAATTPVAEPEFDATRLDAIDAAFESAAREQRAALAGLAAGQGRSARRAAARAQQALIASIEQCSQTAGCEPARLLARFDALQGAGGQVAGENAESGPAPLPELDAIQDSPVLATFPAAAATLRQFNGRDLSEWIVQNEPVHAAKAEWLTSLRPQLINAHEQYQFMRFLMWPEFERAGLPEALLFGILARESGGRVHAISTAGAAGPMQFMPATGRRFGLGWQDGFDTRFEPQLAARASVQYLNERFAELGHDLELALAAYNGGEGRLRRLVRQHPGKGFWDPAILHALPRETRDYVPYVLAAAWLFLHPEQYGLEFSQVNGAATLLELAAPASLNQLTICIGNGGTRYGFFRALRNLNPRWLPHTELPAGTELRVPVDVIALYQRNCIEGQRAEHARRLVQARRSQPEPSVAQSAPAARPGGGQHTVRRGDTLSAIARRHGCSAAVLARVNALRAPYTLRPGQRLQLADCAG